MVHRRRDFLKAVGLGAAGLAAWRLRPAMAEGASKAKPNVLLIIADDMCWRDCGCYGNKEVKTPNIDRLAADGMRFDAMFTATAMCAPTRQQLYTGIFPVRNGAYPNHSRVYPAVSGRKLFAVKYSAKSANAGGSYPEQNKGGRKRKKPSQEGRNYT